jgi:hypothetical protein
VGNVANANVALVVSQASQPNITSVGILSSLNVSGTSNGTIGSFANIYTTNIVGFVGSQWTGSIGGPLYYVSSVGLGTSTAFGSNLGVTGNVYVSGEVAGRYFTGGGNGLSNVLSSVLVGNVANANVALVVSQPAQPNITSLGTTSTALTVQGLLIAGNASGLSNLNSANLVGNVANANVALVVSQASQPNITSLGTTSTALTIQGLLIAGNASGLSNLNSSNLVGNVANANVALVVSQASQPNITSVGILTSLNVAGNSNVGGTMFTQNIVSAGFTSNATNTFFNYSTITIPFIYATTLNIASVSNINNAVLNTVNASGISNLTAIWGSLATASQPNITSVGALTGLNVQGLLIASNASGLSNINSANLVGNVANANVALVVSQASQPNITSVGTLGSLVVSGTANVQTTLNVASISTSVQVPTNTGLFMNLNATYTLNSTGNWTGNIAGSITSNLYTLFAPNPTASWTKYGSNPIVTGPSGNGSFRFNQTGPYVFTVVISADYNIKTFALSSNTSDIHSNVADPGTWLYCYRIGVGQNPSTPVTIPFYVDSTTKYYWLDFEAMSRNDNIHRTWYTNVTSEGYTGSYVILRPV